jgi:tRNA-dihydrouridine synthase
MNYYAAPMEGLTDRVWRQAHQKWFGPAGNADRYYAPFISPFFDVHFTVLFL